MSDSIVIQDVDYVVSRDKNGLYQQFQWDSVFKPKYNLVNFKKDSNSIVAVVAKICKRIKFLQDTAMVIKVKVDFKDNQIVKIHITDNVFLDFPKWTSRRDTLVAWINKNHPELAGFLRDQTLKGAQNYSKAIDLYTNK